MSLPARLAVPLLAIALGAAALDLHATARGAAVSPDTVLYVDAARSLLAGRGLVALDVPLCHYPPGYPATLALPGLAGVDPADAARGWNAVLIALNAILLGLATWLAAGRSATAGLAAAALFAASPGILELHAWGASDGLFVAQFLVAFLALALHLERRRRALLAASGAALGFALATRYVGVTLVPPMLVALAWLGQGSPRARARDAGVLLALGVAPLALVLVRNALVATHMTSGRLSLHPPERVHYEHLTDTLAQYWLPVELPFAVRTVAVLAGFALVVAGFRAATRARAATTSGFALLALALAFVLEYVPFVLLAITFAVASEPLDSRILAPVQVCVWVLAVALARRACDARAWRGALVLLALLVVANGIAVLRDAGRWHRYGRGFTDIRWARSACVAHVRALPPDTAVYSNAYDALLWHTGRKVKSLPRKFIPESLHPNPTFAAEMAALREAVARGAHVVVVDMITWRWYLPTAGELEKAHGLPIARRLEDGTVHARGAGR